METLKSFAIILMTSVLVNNYVLSRFLGICPFLGVSKKLNQATGMGMAVIFVMLMATAVTWPIQTFLLVPFELEFMRTIVFILVIAALVQLVEIILGIALLVLAVVISVLVMMQKSKEGNLSGAIAGGSDNFLSGSKKGNNKDKLLSTLTAIFSVIFGILVVAMYVIVG